MKLLFCILLLFSMQVYSQVGIGTTDPTATLDVNGKVRIGTIDEELDLDVVKDSILALSNTVNTITSKDIYETNIKSAVKGKFSENTTFTFTGSSGNKNKSIVFDSEIYDVNNEFTNGVFTAKEDGIYHVYIQIAPTGTLHISPNYGVRIFKNGVLYSQQNFANVGVDLSIVLTINVTPPIRSVQTLMQLEAGDTIDFGLYTYKTSIGLFTLNVTLSGAEKDSFFTINQIR
ncbi:hypothetical protein [Aequorivita sp. Q41]|uniref:hypothetical protein n=1 Tax=Aequorivita sp. Q41 TaxID=3153300 RepID=UPI0032423D15